MKTSKYPDVLIKPMIITEKIYEGLFAPLYYKKHEFPAIDPFFKEFLGKEIISSDTIVRRFDVNPQEYPESPLYYLNSNVNALYLLSFSADTIISYAIQNYQDLAERNLCIWRPDRSKEILKLIDLRFSEEKNLVKKFSIQCYHYLSWETICRSSIEREAKFFVSLT